MCALLLIYGPNACSRATKKHIMPVTTGLQQVQHKILSSLLFGLFYTLPNDIDRLHTSGTCRTGSKHGQPHSSGL